MREHEVPTHIQAEDKVLLGLTFPQIVSLATVCGLAYGLWRYADFLPEGAFRITAALAVGAVGLALVVVRPGGRTLLAAALDILRFALTPRRYEGSVADLVRSRPVEPPGGARKRSRRDRLASLRPGWPFRCLCLVLAVVVLLTSNGPHTAVAGGPLRTADNAQRLFIEHWRVTNDRASVAVRAATALEVRVVAQTADGDEVYNAQHVLFRGEQRVYDIPLSGSHRAIVISWRDAIGNAGIEVLDQTNFPHPLPNIQGEDCAIRMEAVEWRQGQVAGRIASSCSDQATEVVDAVVLTDPADPSRTVRQRLLIDALIQDVRGSLRLAAAGPDSGVAADLPFVPDSAVPFALSLPGRAGVYTASLDADLTSTRVGELPGRVDLTHHGDQKVNRRVPVVAWFEGFFTRVSSVLRAVWDPFVHTVSATLSAWFSPIVRTISATLEATWASITRTIGAWVSTTVAKWVSTIVRALVWANVGAWLSAVVGAWVSTIVGSWIWTTVGKWVSTWVGGFFTTVSKWVNWFLGWLSFSVWVPAKLASGFASGIASGYASGVASGYASGTASTYASGIASGYASGTASGYARGTASGYASTEVTVPGRTAQRTVSETVTIPGKKREKTVSEEVVVPGRTAEQEVSRDVWVPGKRVEQEVQVQIVIPGYTSANLAPPQPLVREHRERLSASFALFSDATYAAIPARPDDGETPSQIQQYVVLLDDQTSEDGGSGSDATINPYEDALNRMKNNPYFTLHPDEAALLRSALFLAWIDSLSIPIDARVVMEVEAGGVVSLREYQPGELGAESISAQELFRVLVGGELR